MLSDDNDREEVKLSKTALRIYLYLLNKNREVGPREIAKDLGISPSLVHYHLKRMESMGLVSKGSEGYKVASVMKIEGFIALGRRLVPRMYIYSSFFAGLILAEVVGVITRVTPLSGSIALAMIASIFGFVTTLLEGYLIHRKLRNFRSFAG